MNGEASAGSGSLNIGKWLMVAVLVGVGVVGNAYYADQSLILRVLVLAVLALAAGAVALTTTQGAAFIKLARESRSEILKVVWPTHQETLQTTLVVAVVVLVMALILWALDAILGKLAALLIG